MTLAEDQDREQELLNEIDALTISDSAKDDRLRTYEQTLKLAHPLVKSIHDLLGAKPRLSPEVFEWIYPAIGWISEVKSVLEVQAEFEDITFSSE